MLLHTVNKSPFNGSALETCLHYAKAGSSVLMIEDGVYGAIKGSRVASTVSNATSDCKVYALGPDLDARGISADQIIDGVTVVDYAGFVDLSAENDAVQSWL